MNYLPQATDNCNQNSSNCSLNDNKWKIVVKNLIIDCDCFFVQVLPSLVNAINKSYIKSIKNPSITLRIESNNTLMPNKASNDSNCFFN